MNEHWRSIAGFEGFYEVSNLGRVRSLTHKARGKSNSEVTHEGQLLNPTLNSDGYHVLTLSRDGKTIQRKVHRVVAQAFHPNPMGFPCVNHIDFNKINNQSVNLEWCTNAHNMRHDWNHGRRRSPKIASHGSKNGNAKLSDDNVTEIRRRNVDGETNVALAAEFGVCKDTISRIIRREAWKSLK